MKEFGYNTHELRSKSWEEFAAEGAPAFDFVFTVCENAAASCPTFPGAPMTAHWPIDDPALVSEDKQKTAFWHAYTALQRRIDLFLSLPIESVDQMSLKSRLRSIPAGADIDQHAA